MEDTATSLAPAVPRPMAPASSTQARKRGASPTNASSSGPKRTHSAAMAAVTHSRPATTAMRFRTIAWCRAVSPGAGAMGRVLFVAANMAQVVFAFLPGEPLELGAGYAFGFWEGTLWCLVASALGTALVMVLVRAFGMRLVGLFFPPEKIASVRWLRDARRFELLLFLVFLIPGTPKDLLTYVAGLGTSPVWRIVALTTVGRIPSIVSSTLAAGALGDGNYTVAAVTVVLTLALVAAGVVAYRRLAARQAAEQE